MENGNKFSKAITHGNNQQIIGATYREQLTGEGCKRVIANAINCYNLLYLSDLYQKCTGAAQKEALLFSGFAFVHAQTTPLVTKAKQVQIKEIDLLYNFSSIGHKAALNYNHFFGRHAITIDRYPSSFKHDYS